MDRARFSPSVSAPHDIQMSPVHSKSLPELLCLYFHEILKMKLNAGNILLLQKKVHIHPDNAFVDFGQLIQLVGDYLVDSNPPHPVR
jgi:hypothetical protein